MGERKVYKQILILVIYLMMGICEGAENLRKAVPKVPIYIINHSSLPVGYRKSLSSYFYKRNNDVDRRRDVSGGVRSIFRSILGELIIDPQKKFLINNALYFQLYYEHSNDNIRKQWQKLINARDKEQSRIEFVGSYTELDENIVYWDDLIDSNMLAGEFWRKRFNKTIEVGWQVENPGYSGGYISLLYQMGIKMVFINRIDYQDKFERRNRNKRNFDSNVFIFAPEQQNRDTPVLAYILDSDTYPPFFNFDLNEENTVMNEPIRDINHVIVNTTVNLQSRAEQFLDYFRWQREQTNNTDMLQFLGGEFTLQSSGQVYENYDKLINHINAKSKYNAQLQHILPKQWLNHLYKQINQPDNQLEVKRGDFAISRQNANNYLSGVFSTRISFKYFVRDFSTFLNQVRNIFGTFYLNEKTIKQYQKQKSNNHTHFLSSNKEKVLENLHNLEKGVSLSNSHHAITGSCYEAVIFEYREILQKTKLNVMMDLENHVKQIFNDEYDEQVNNWIHCNYNDTLIISCPMLNFRLKYNKPVLIGIYNQLQHETTQLLKIKVGNRQVVIRNSDNVEIPDQEVFCTNPFDHSDCELYFISTLKRQSFNFYKISVDSSIKKNQQKRFDFSHSQGNDHVIETSKWNFLQIQRSLQQFVYSFCGSQNIKDKNCDRIGFEIQMGEHESWEYSDNPKGDNTNYNSGYYVLHMRPDQRFYQKYYEKGSFYLGTLLSKLYLYADRGNIQTILTFYTNKVAERVDNIIDWKRVEIEHIIEPLQIQHRGKELVCKMRLDGFTTNIYGHPVNEFYTDRNGLDLQKRLEDKREDYELQHQAKIEQNIYPVTSIFQLKNHMQQRVSVITDRTLGMGMVNGEINMLLQRAFRGHDALGVHDKLEEQDEFRNNIKVRESMTLVFQLYSNELQNHRKIQFYKDNPVMILNAKTDSYKFDFIYPQQTSIPDFLENTFVISNKMIKTQYLPRPDGTIFMRVFNNLEDQYQQFRNPFDYIKELSLQGSMTIEQLNKLHSDYSLKNVTLKNNYKLNDNHIIAEQQQYLLDKNIVRLMPLQIRTFLVGDESSFQKYSELEDHQSHDYEKYYHENEKEEFLDIDLSAFGGNGTNITANFTTK